MSKSKPAPQEPGGDPLAADLKLRLCTLVDLITQRNENEAKEEFEHFHQKAKELVKRKLTMVGTKNDTRDLLGEVLFARLRKGLREFLRSQDARQEIKVAEWLIGTWLAGGALAEFASALDRAILEAGTCDYSFAGRADFISVEEVMQMLAAGKHSGCLVLEKADNRIDIWMDRGLVAFLDPHHMIRRVLPSSNRMKYREISGEMLQQAEQMHAHQSVPMFLALRDLGFFKPDELRGMMRVLGEEVIHDFLRDQTSCTFFYRRSNDLPAYVKELSLRLGVTPILLEGSKRIDDWRTLAKAFPDPAAPVEPVPDMFARISSMDLGVLEIKMLAQINGETSPSQLVDAMGLPLPEVYQMLVRFAKSGVIVAEGDLEAVPEDGLGIDESMQEAFDALNANDDHTALASALGKVLGDEGEGDSGDDKLGRDKLEAGRRRPK